MTRAPIGQGEQGSGVRAGSRASHGTGDAVSAVPASIPDALNLPWTDPRGPDKRQCECRLCERGREFERQIARLSPARKAYFRKLYDCLLDTETLLEMHEAAWPKKAAGQ